MSRKPTESTGPSSSKVGVERTMKEFQQGIELFAIIGGNVEDNPIKWNPYNKVVQDHRDGTIDYEATN